MEDLIISGTETTPEIKFNSQSGELSLIGRSFPEDSYSFYKPILSWLNDYSGESQNKTTLTVELEYFNSGSLKQIYKILYYLEDLEELGKSASVVWRYKSNDELMQQKGLEFKKFLQIPVELETI